MIRKRRFRSLINEHFTPLCAEYGFDIGSQGGDWRMYMFVEFVRKEEVLRISVDNRDEDFDVHYYPNGLPMNTLPTPVTLHSLVARILLDDPERSHYGDRSVARIIGQLRPSESVFPLASALLGLCLLKSSGTLLSANS